jgi:hypothetical protein
MTLLCLTLWTLAQAAPAASPSPAPAASPAAASPAPTPAPTPVPTPDPKAVAIADRVLEALGGKDAWDKTRYLRFDFGVEREGKLQTRAHTWDKWTGRYRLEAQTREGEPFVVLMNVNTKEGKAWLKGQPADPEKEKDLVQRAYGAWINDTYWLIMPYKMKDPGVILQYDGEEKGEGATWDKVLLSFDNVGLTPRDKYWAFVNRETGLVDRWDFVLRGETTPPATFLWKGWTKKGGIMLAPERFNPKEGRRIAFPVMDVPAEVADSVFTNP